MNRNLKRLIRKKVFKKAKKSEMDEDRARYLDIEQMVKRDAERVYVNGILQNGLESGNNKPFWKYMKSPKSVFTPQSGNTFAQLPGTQFLKFNPLHISENCVFMLLDRIDASKSSGLD